MLANCSSFFSPGVGILLLLSRAILVRSGVLDSTLGGIAGNSQFRSSDLFFSRAAAFLLPLCLVFVGLGVEGLLDHWSWVGPLLLFSSSYCSGVFLPTSPNPFSLSGNSSSFSTSDSFLETDGVTISSLKCEETFALPSVRTFFLFLYFRSVPESALHRSVPPSSSAIPFSFLLYHVMLLRLLFFRGRQHSGIACS